MPEGIPERGRELEQLLVAPMGKEPTRFLVFIRFNASAVRATISEHRAQSSHATPHISSVLGLNPASQLPAKIVPLRASSTAAAAAAWGHATYWISPLGYFTERDRCSARGPLRCPSHDLRKVD